MKSRCSGSLGSLARSCQGTPTIDATEIRDGSRPPANSGFCTEHTRAIRNRRRREALDVARRSGTRKSMPNRRFCSQQRRLRASEVSLWNSGAHAGSECERLAAGGRCRFDRVAGPATRIVGIGGASARRPRQSEDATFICTPLRRQPAIPPSTHAAIVLVAQDHHQHRGVRTQEAGALGEQLLVHALELRLRLLTFTTALGGSGSIRKRYIASSWASKPQPISPACTM